MSVDALKKNALPFKILLLNVEAALLARNAWTCTLALRGKMKTGGGVGEEGMGRS